MFIVLPERPTCEQLIALAKSDPEAFADLVLMLWDRVEALEARVGELERNPTGSPAATAVACLRRIAAASTRLPGPGACGKNPVARRAGRMVMSGKRSTRPIPPHRIVEHRLGVGTSCPNCGEIFGEGDGPRHADDCARRQVFELPAIRLKIIRHRAECRVCRNCDTVIAASFSVGVKSPVQDVESLQSAAADFNVRQMISCARCAGLFADFFI